MSSITSISIFLEEHSQKNFLVKSLVHDLVKNGWTLNNNGYVTFLPKGDYGNFDWIKEKKSLNDLMKILEEKEKNEEINAFSIFKIGTNIGGNLTINSKTELIFILNINRKTIENGKTDVNWYLDKYVDIFKNNNYNILSVNYEEF